MENLKDILSILGLIVLPYLAYLHKRLNTMSKTLSRRVTHLQMQEYVDLKQQPNNVKLDSLNDKIEDVKEDLDRCNDKLDGIKDILLDSKN